MRRWTTLGLECLVAASVCASVGCGDDVILRPLSVDIQGLSSGAEVLIVQLIPGSQAPTCSQVSAANVTSFGAPIRLMWSRTEGGERRLAAPNVEADRVTVIAHSEDASGALLQLGCQEIDYLDIESPEVEIALMSLSS